MHEQLFEQLRMDHQEIKKTLSHMSGARATEQKNESKKRLELLLLPHMRAEEAVFYPALKEKRESREAALEAFEEHHAAETIFNELMQLRPESENWKAKAVVLKEVIEHHIQEEEQRIFQIAGKVITKQAAENMLTDFAEEKIWHVSRIRGETIEEPALESGSGTPQ